MPRPLYVALGDALGTDDVAGGPGCGAASLLYRDNGVFEGFEERDLRHRMPGSTFRNLAREGATSAAIAVDQLPDLEGPPGEIRVVTITAGRDDWLQIWGAELQTGEIAARDLAVQLEEVLSEVRRVAGPDATLLLANLPDPTDGTGDWEAIAGEPWEDGLLVLDLFNRTIEEVADDHDAELVDLHGRFLGHGLAASDPDHPRHDPEDPSVWFVEGVELNARGASELRRLFWEALEGLA